MIFKHLPNPLCFDATAASSISPNSLKALRTSVAVAIFRIPVIMTVVTGSSLANCKLSSAAHSWMALDASSGPRTPCRTLDTILFSISCINVCLRERKNNKRTSR